MEKDLSTIRHSMSHVMAEAVLEMFPDAQIAIGPSIENGFYYDFALPRQLTEADLDEITERMKKIIRSDKEFKRIEVSREEAKKMFAGQKFKLELIDAIPEGETVTVYNQGAFIAGAYWRGSEKNEMLTRIYGTAWSTGKELRAYLDHLADVERRDHRKLGKDLDLFSLHEEAGPGLVYWHPRGARVRQIIEQFWREEHYKNGYEMVYTPHVGKSWLWETSGHLSFYKESMYPPMEMDKADYYVKPMNCPFHIMIYNNSLRSYRDLPCRWAELGTVYRYEKAGALHGLLRVRGFTQDDAHLFCTPEQMDDEIEEVLRFSLHMLRSFGFTEIHAYISTRPEKSVGDPALWDSATVALTKAVEKAGLAYDIDEGGGAFYGPKIDLKIKDAIGREWQLSTVQFDFNLPQRFKMTYVDKDGKEKQPLMIHRALLGSIERFFGVLLENYAGAFPPWLAPEQIAIVPVGEMAFAYASELEARFRAAGLRAYTDLSSERMNAKIRKAQQMKVPYQVIVGEKEMNDDLVSVRYRTGRQKNGLKTDDFIAEVKAVVDSKAQLE